ncbi:hypothetical protein J6590_035667 [Homalodisca vitripennis]|nr:hypothetical protein J6590_035667 [Homalodisca vitripennis]
MYQQGKLYIGVGNVIHLDQKCSYTGNAYEKRAKPRETARTYEHLDFEPKHVYYVTCNIEGSDCRHVTSVSGQSRQRWVISRLLRSFITTESRNVIMEAWRNSGREGNHVTCHTSAFPPNLTEARLDGMVPLIDIIFWQAVCWNWSGPLDHNVEMDHHSCRKQITDLNFGKVCL